MQRFGVFYSLLFLFSPGLCFAQVADFVLINASIYTVNQAQPRAEAMAILDGKILAVGNETEIEKHMESDTKIIDAGGFFVMPGFIDTHNHVFEGASEAGGSCLLSRRRQALNQLKLLQACKDDVKNSSEWVIGYGHELYTFWGNEDDLNPKHILDEIFPDNPVVIMEESSHSMLVNSKALELSGIDKDSVHPQGGRIMFGKDGEPNGLLFDNAGDIVMEQAWNSLDDNYHASYDGLLAGLEIAAGVGITTIGDGRMYWRRGWYEVWQDVFENGELTARVSVRPWVYPEVEIAEQLPRFVEMFTDDKNQLLIVDQVKLYIDGVMHFGTAKVIEPYNWSWQENLPYGLNYISATALSVVLEKLADIGYSAHIHAIGDGGVRESLNAIAQQRDRGSKLNYSLTHLEMIDEADIPRFVELGVDADFQAGAEFFEYTGWATEFIGRQRANAMFPMKEVYETGANLTFSSDWTVNSINPLVAIANSMKMKDSKGLPNIEEAIKASTINGAKALGLDQVTGSIEVGKSADFVVLNTNLLDASLHKIKSTEVLMTAVQGRIVHQLPGVL